LLFHNPFLAQLSKPKIDYNMNPSMYNFIKSQALLRCCMLLALCLGLNPAETSAQTMFNYTNDATGAPAFVAPNVTGDSLARGGGVSGASLTCNGPNDGFGADGWPTTNIFDVAAFEVAGDYITFTLTPDVGYGLKITGFSARSRRENYTGTSNDGPIGLRYGYSIDGGSSWIIVNPGNAQSSNVCASSGVLRVWPSFVTLNASTPVIFRIYGLSSGSAGTGDLILRDIVVTGDVCANAPSLSPVPGAFSVCSGTTTASYFYMLKDADTYTIDYNMDAEAQGFQDVPTTNIPAVPGPIGLVIPATADPDTYNGTMTVRNTCGFATNYNFTVTIHPLPMVSCPGNTTVCVNSSAYSLDGGMPGGGTYTGAGVSANNFDPAAAGVGTHTITYSYTDGNNCTNSCTFDITVNPIEATANAGDDQMTCVDGIILISGGIVGTPGTGTWTSNVGGGSFSPNETSLNAYYTPPSGYSDPITLTLTPDGQCVTPDFLVVTYGPLDPLVLEMSGPSAATCGDEVTFSVVVASGFNDIASLQYAVTWNDAELMYMPPANAPAIGVDLPAISNPSSGQVNYVWFGTGLNGEDLLDGTTLLSLTFKVISNSGLSSLNISDLISMYSLIEATNAQSCVLDVEVSGADLTINPISVTCPNDITVCVNDDAFPLTGAIPSGGDYSGAGVSGNEFNPATAMVGEHVITYTYTNNDDCSNTCTFTITVNPLPDVSASNKSICSGGNTNLTVSNPNMVGGTFNWVADYGAVTGGAGSSLGNAYGVGAISEVLTNNTGLPIVVKYTLTPLGPDPTNCVGSFFDVFVTVEPRPIFAFSASTTSGGSQTSSNSAGPATITANFCAGDLLTLSLYSDNGPVGYLGSYTSSGNTTYDGGAIGAGPVIFDVFPNDAAGFFGTTYGGTLGYGLSAGTFGTITQIFTPYIDINNNNAYDLGVDCLGDPITLQYNIYAPISLTITRNTGNEICSGDNVDYTIATTSTQTVSFDLVLEANSNANNPADLTDDNTLPTTLTGLTISSGSPYNFTQVLNNAVGLFDRGRVRVRAINIGYVDADVCNTADVVGQNTQVYPEPRLAQTANKLICDGNNTALDVQLHASSLPSTNTGTAGYPVRIEWTVVAPGISGASNGFIDIYDDFGMNLNGALDIAQNLTLNIPGNGPQTATYTITPRASGPSDAFNADDCFGDPITVVVTVVPPSTPNITGPATVHAGAQIQLTGTDNVMLPASLDSTSWMSNSALATVDGNGLVTGVTAGGPVTITYTVTDDAGCTSSATHVINVLEPLTLTSLIQGSSMVGCGSEITVDVQVSNFQDINSLDFSINWDPTKFQYVGHTAPAIDGSVPTIPLGGTGLGQLAFLWFDNADPFSASLPDGTVLMTYTLRAIGAAGPSNALITDVPNPRDAYNSNFSQVPVSSSGVTIEIVPLSLTSVGPVAQICPNEGTANLPFSGLIGNATDYMITYDGAAQMAGFPPMVSGTLDLMAGYIVLVVPTGLPAGMYNGTLVIKNQYGCTSVGYPFAVTIDQTPPSASNPGPIVQSCMPAPAPDPLVVVGEMDNCPGPLSVVWVSDTDDGGSGCGITPKIITRTYEVSDVAGNTTTVTQTITMLDNQAPTVSTSGMALWYQTEAEAVAAAIAIANQTKADNCTPFNGITVSLGTVPTYDGCKVTIHLIVSDACGNIANVDYMTVIDTEAPTADVGPIDDCYEPSEELNPYGVYQYAVEAAILATVGNDDCTDPEDLVYTAVFSGSHCALAIDVTVTDACGKSSTFSYLTRVDGTAPIISASPDALSIENGNCFETVEEAEAAAIAETLANVGDDCGSPGSLQIEAFTSRGCPAEILVVVTDFCGNSSEITYTDVHIDDEAPTVFPDEGHPTCFMSEAAAFEALIAASNVEDNCTSYEDLIASADPVFVEDTPNDGCMDGTVTITFTDRCGHSASIVFSGIVIDNVPPQLVSFPPVLSSYACVDDVDAPDAEAVVGSDNCSEVLTPTWEGDLGPSSCPGIIYRTYRLTDACGNTADFVQEIMVNDDEAPVWITPADELDRTYSCDDPNYVDAFREVPEAGDNCGEVVLVKTTGNFVPSQDCPQEGTYTNTWTATDFCNNTATTVFTQVITIVDNLAPVVNFGCQFMPPLELTTENGADCPADADINLEVGQTISPLQTWFVAGIEIPNLEFCVIDNCSDLEEIRITLVSVEYAEDENYEEGCSKLITATFQIADACGNAADPFVCQYLIIDNTPPQWNTPEGQPFPVGIDVAISCSDGAALVFANSLAPTATDNCPGDVTIVKTDGVFVPGGDCPSEGTITNTWVATDACGNNSVTFTQVIALFDNEPPTFDPDCQLMPLTLTTYDGYACPFNAGLTGLVVNQIIDINTTWNVAGFEVPSLAGCVFDNCADPSTIIIKVLSIENVYDEELCDRTITVSFQLTDPCGNVQEEPFVCIYHIIDNTAPQIFCVQRMGDDPVLPESCYPNAAAAEADALELISPCDDCSPYEDLDISVSTVGTCNAEVTVTVADCAGNQASYTFYTKIDGTGPTLTQGTIPGCFPDVTSAEAAAMAATTSTDNCPGGLSIAAETTGTCPASITVTVTDGCGNSSFVVYNNICIGTGSAVTITTPASDQTVDCSNEVSGLAAWLANNGGAVATGNGVVWTYTPDPIVFGPINCMTHSKSVTVTFKATDNCGYMATTTATFTVQDLTAPTVNSISTTNLNCSTQVPAPDLNLVTGVMDNCDSSPTIALFSNTSNGGAGCPGNPLILLRTYSVTDDYCNTTYVSHTINIVDNIPPTFNAPANITINVNAGCVYDASPGVTGNAFNMNDNCSLGMNVPQYIDVVTPGNQNQEKYIITRTWELKDNCGNGAQPLTQIITVKDVTPPTITCPNPVYQAGGVVENNSCAWLGSGLTPAFDDNCDGESLSYTLSGFFTGNSSGVGSVDGRLFLEGETTVTYTVTDWVGNTATCSFVVNVNCTTISGRIIWEHNKTSGVKDATVRLTFGMLNLGSTLSDLAGNYSLSTNVLGVHTITPVKNINRFNGVTSADATAIQQHIAGTNVITDPYKKVAADVNRNGFITSQDANLILQSLSGNAVALATFNVFWRFTPTTYVMPVTPPTTVPAFPENITVNVTGPDVTGQDFYGMKIGDVNGSADPSMAPTGTPLTWMLKDQVLQAGAEVALNFTTTNFNDLAAVQFGLDFDPEYLQFAGFESLDAIPLTADNFGVADAVNGELRFVWAQAMGISLADGTPVMKARFKVLKGGQKLSQVVKLDEQILPGRAYTESLVAAEVRVVFVESVAAGDPATLGKLQLQLFQNNPNPFAGATTIGFVLPEACEAQLRVMDVSGRELSNYKRNYTAGYHEIDFRMDNAAAYGVLYYELSTPFGKLSRKMVTVK
jgi:Cohesin domain/HYR domain/Dockerin type I domain/Bacterial Ig-like domain (group 2)